MRELTELKTNPPEGIRVVTNEDNMLDVLGIIQGPGTRPVRSSFSSTHMLRQRVHRTPAAISMSNSALQTNSLLPLQSVRALTYLELYLWLTGR